MKFAAFIAVTLYIVSGFSINEDGNQNSVYDAIRQHQIAANRPLKDLDQIKGEIPCDVCEAAITEIHELLANPHTVDDIKAALRKNICTQLAGDSRVFCDGAVDNIEAVIHFLNPMLMDEHGLCKKLDLCATSHKQRMLLFTKHIMKSHQIHGQSLALASSNDVACDECKLGVSALHDAVTEKDFQQNSEEICQELGLCSGAAPYAQFRSLIQSVQDAPSQISSLNQSALQQFYTVTKHMQTRQGVHVKCVACEFAIQTFKTLAEDSTDDLNYLVGKVEDVVCGLMPNPINEQCIDFLNYYGRTALIMTVRQLNEERVCDMISACSESDKDLLLQHMSIRNDIECEACEAGVSYLKSELDNPNFQQSVVKALLNICKELPGDKETCESYLQTYMPYGIQAYAAILQYDRKPLCQQLGACSN